MKINPKFDYDLFNQPGLNDPEVIKNGVLKIVKKEEPTSHAELLQKLLQQIKQIDFETQANPNGTDNFKISKKHYLVLSIENLLTLAEKKRWGLTKKHDFIYLYNGTFWAEVETDGFMKFLGEAAERMGVEKFDARYYQFKEQLFKQFLTAAILPAPKSNDDKVLINLKNGTFEISPEERKLREFSRKDFITYQLPFDYVPSADAPLFQKYLNRVLPDKERQLVLAEYIGYVFIKHGSNALKEEKALVLYGTGANGKSVFFEIINALLGNENVSSFSLQSITNDNGYFRAKLANKLVNYASEINGSLESSIFKQLVSGEPVEARLPYGQPFMLRQYAKLIFNCNELPKDVEHTNAYFRRFLIVPFDETIPEHEQDKNLHTKIIDNELSGIFNWVLAGLDRLLQQKKFSACEAAERALEQYKTESNSIKLFIDDNNYKKSLSDYRLVKELYSEYRTFCMEDGMKPFSKRNFTKQLRALGYTVEKVTDNKSAVFIKSSEQNF